MRPPKYQSPSGRPMRQCRFLRVRSHRYERAPDGEFLITGRYYVFVEFYRRCQGWAMPKSRYCRIHQKKGKG